MRVTSCAVEQMSEQTGVNTDSSYLRRCWSPPCRRRGWIEDGMGWRWCAFHWWYHGRWGGMEQTLSMWRYYVRASVMATLRGILRRRSV